MAGCSVAFADLHARKDYWKRAANAFFVRNGELQRDSVLCLQLSVFH